MIRPEDIRQMARLGIAAPLMVVRGDGALVSAALARERYACLTPWQPDPATYGRMATSGTLSDCESEVLQILLELHRKHVEYAEKDGERFLDAVQNARLVANAERYYRTMYHGSHESWNLRDTYMYETLDTLRTRWRQDDPERALSDDEIRSLYRLHLYADPADGRLLGAVGLGAVLVGLNLARLRRYVSDDALVTLVGRGMDELRGVRAGETHEDGREGYADDPRAHCQPDSPSMLIHPRRRPFRSHPHVPATE